MARVILSSALVLFGLTILFVGLCIFTYRDSKRRAIRRYGRQAGFSTTEIDEILAREHL